MQNLKGHVKINNISKFIDQLQNCRLRCVESISYVESKFNSWSRDNYTKRMFLKDRTEEESRIAALSDKYVEEVWNYYEDISYLKKKKRNLDKLLVIAVNCLTQGNELNLSFEDYYMVLE